MTCPADMTVSVDETCSFTMLDYTLSATYSDNCGPVTLTQDPMSGTMVTTNVMGETVTITATDKYGNSTTCTFTIYPLDQTPPAVTCMAMSVTLDANCEYELTSVASAVTGTDNCTPSMSLTFTPDAGVLPHTFSFHGEELIVTVTTSDMAGNTSVCAVTVTALGPHATEFDELSCECGLVQREG